LEEKFFVQSKATTVEQYLSELPAERRAALEAVRNVILANLDKDYEEGILYGMIGYFVPHRVFSAGYHCDPKQPLQFAGLASQKNHMSLYLMCIYGHEPSATWFHDAWAKTGKKLDMGKSCIRFKGIDDLPLEVIGEAIRRVPAKKYVEHYEQVLRMMAARPTKGPPGKKAAGKEPNASEKPARKKS
jgi:hypothetical protein